MPNSIEVLSGEALLVAVDFSPQLAEGVSIVSSNARGTTAVKAFDSSGTEKTSEIIESPGAEIVGSRVQARLYGTGSNTSYTVSFYAATSNGDFLETRISLWSEE